VFDAFCFTNLTFGYSVAPFNSMIDREKNLINENPGKPSKSHLLNAKSNFGVKRTWNVCVGKS